MIENTMSESTARFTFVAASGLSLFAVIASITLGMRDSQTPAALFLALAVVGAIVTWVSYRRYTSLRKERWAIELAKSENELNQVLNHTRMNMIMEHVTGPLGAEIVDGGPGPDPAPTEEQPGDKQ